MYTRTIKAKKRPELHLSSSWDMYTPVGPLSLTHPNTQTLSKLLFSLFLFSVFPVQFGSVWYILDIDIDLVIMVCVWFYLLPETRRHSPKSRPLILFERSSEIFQIPRSRRRRRRRRRHLSLSYTYTHNRS